MGNKETWERDQKRIKQNQLQLFFESWGLYPSEEKTDDLNTEVIRNGINRRCYEKMIGEARFLYGASAVDIFRNAIYAIDDSYFLRYKKWSELPG